MSGLKKLLFGFVTLCVLFCIYWALGRTVMIKTATEEIKNLQNDGYVIAHKSMTVGGFPLQFRMKLIEPDVVSPRSNEKPWSIKSEELTLNASAFNPFRWTAKHRGDARLDIRGPKGERWLFDAQPMIIDMNSRFSFTGKLKAAKATLFRAKAQAVIGKLPPIIAIDSAVIEATPSQGNMQINWSFKNTFLEQNTLKTWQTAFGPKLELIEGRALAIGLSSLEDEPGNAWKQTGQIICQNWTVIWDGTTFQGGCDLTQSFQGFNGVINVNVRDVPRLISTLEEAGILTERQARTVMMGSVLLPVNKNGDRELKISLRDGFLTLFGQKIYAFN